MAEDNSSGPLMENATDDDVNSSEMSYSDNSYDQAQPHHTELTSFQPDLSFNKKSIPDEFSKKIEELTNLIKDNNVSSDDLKKHAMSPGGFVIDEIRKELWPKLLKVDMNTDVDSNSSIDEVLNHSEHNQVVLDVKRALKRFPPGIEIDQRLALEDKLTLLILKVMYSHPELKYYQGYHDVAITFLLVFEEDVERTYKILEVVSTEYLRESMNITMDEISYVLNFMFPLVRKKNESLFKYIDESTVGTIFCLPWYITWFSHNLNKYSDVVRLFDYFLASDKLFPIYFITIIILFREKEIFDTPCDMPSLHCLLSEIPEDLPFEELLKGATELYLEYPPDSIKPLVDERMYLEAERKKKELEEIQQKRAELEARRNAREETNRRNNTISKRIMNLVPPWMYPTSKFGIFIATTSILAAVWAVFLKGSDSNMNIIPLFNRLFSLWGLINPIALKNATSKVINTVINNKTDVLEPVGEIINSVIENNTKT